MAIATDYSSQGVGKIVVLVLEFTDIAGESASLRQSRNVALTRVFKSWLKRQIGYSDLYLAHQAGDVNSVEFLWDSALDVGSVNQALNLVPFHPDVKKVRIRFQGKSAIAV